MRHGDASRTGRRTGNAGVPDNAGPILADLLFRHDQGTTATNVLRRSATGWDGCCAERVEAAVVVGKRIELERALRLVPRPALTFAGKLSRHGVSSHPPEI